MEWKLNKNFFERQEYRRNEIRSYIKGCKRIDASDLLNQSIKREHCLKRVQYLSSYLQLLEELYEVLYYGDGIKRTIRNRLQLLFNSLNAKPFFELGPENVESFEWILNALSNVNQKRERDCFTELDVQKLLLSLKKMVDTIR